MEIVSVQKRFLNGIRANLYWFDAVSAFLPLAMDGPIAGQREMKIHWAPVDLIRVRTRSSD